MAFFDCPYCSYDKEVPDSYYGKKIKCPRCLATLTLGVPQPTALTALPLPEDDASPLEQMAIEVDKCDTLTECPFCFELINTQVDQCPKCKRLIHQNEQKKTTAILENVIAGTVKVRRAWYCGILSLICGVGVILGPLAIIMGLHHRKLSLEPKDKEMVYNAILLGIAGTVGSLLLLTVVLWVMLQ